MNQPNELDTKSFISHLATLRPKEALASILDSNQALTLVQALPAQDLLYLIKANGLSDSLELLELSSKEQFRSLLDLDGWSGFHITTSSLGDYLYGLMHINERKAVQHFRGLDIELLVLLFKLHTTIFETEEGVDLPDLSSIQSTTPCGRYVIFFDDKAKDQNLVQFLYRSLEQLYGRDMKFVFGLLEAIRYETPSMLEEDALRWRDARMQDLGFAPLEEAKKILAFSEPSQIFELSPKRAPISKEPATFSTLTKPLFDFSKNSLLQEVISSLSLDAQEIFLQQLVSATNRVHLGLDGQMGDMSALKKTSQYVRNMIEIGLQFLQKSTGEKPTESQVFAPEEYFKAGHSLILKLSRKLNTQVRNKDSGLFGKGLLRLDSPLQELCVGLLQKEPMLFAGLVDPKRVDFRPFENFEDILAAAQALTEVLFRAKTAHALGITDMWAEEKGLDSKDKQPTTAKIVGTYLCNGLIEKLPSLNDFNEEKLNKLLRLASKTSATFPAKLYKKAEAMLEAKIAPLVPSPGLATGEEAQQRAKAYARVVLGAIEAELTNPQAMKELLLV